MIGGIGGGSPPGGGGGGCDSPHEMAKLPEEGYLDISHLLDVRLQSCGA